MASKPLRKFVRIANRLLCIVLLLNATYIVAIAIEPVPADEQEQIDKLIAALVSPNKAPPFKDDVGVPHSFRPNKAQDRVLVARDDLLAKGMVAFPSLIRHSQDSSYSYTDQSQKSYWWNVKVKTVCYQIIADQVEVYQRFVTLGPPKRSWVPFGQEKLEEWWNSHKQLSLREIQLEGAMWALERQRKEGFVSKEHEAAVLGDLNRLIKRLESSDKPILVGPNGEFIDEPDLKRTEW